MKRRRLLRSWAVSAYLGATTSRNWWSVPSVPATCCPRDAIAVLWWFRRNIAGHSVSSNRSSNQVCVFHLGAEMVHCATVVQHDVRPSCLFRGRHLRSRGLASLFRRHIVSGTQSRHLHVLGHRHLLQREPGPADDTTHAQRQWSGICCAGRTRTAVARQAQRGLGARNPSRAAAHQLTQRLTACHHRTCSMMRRMMTGCVMALRRARCLASRKMHSRSLARSIRPSLPTTSPPNTATTFCTQPYCGYNIKKGDMELP